MTIRVACVGAGPGGLFFSILLRRFVPDARVTVFERNRPTDAFGFGVVFSDAALSRIDDVDPVLRDGLRDHGRHWDTIEMRAKGEVHTFAGNAMSAIHRRTLLHLLQDRAAQAGVEVRFSTPVTLAELADRGEFDMIVGADGAHSGTRAALATTRPDGLGHRVQAATTKYIWFGTTYEFAGLTNIHRRTEHGNIAVVAYPISPGLSTFVAETDEGTWRRAGFDSFDTEQPHGASDLESQRYLEDVFADDIPGHSLVGNNSRWANFLTRRTDTWHSGNVVLLGDALHTAHFSVGSGTTMAMEDAVVLAREVARSVDDLSTAFTRYEDERKQAVAKIQSAARPSLSWWEHFEAYYEAFDPLQFTFHYFTRHLTLAKLRQRDAGLADEVESRWAQTYGAPALDSPLRAGAVQFPGRYLRLRHDPVRRLTDREEDVHLPVSSGSESRSDGAAVLVRAPEDESGVDTAVAALPTTGVVVIEGGTALTRSLLADEARLNRKLVAVVVEDCDEDRAATLVLSGRADAVATRRGDDCAHA